MRIEITVAGGLGELALEAIGLHGADLTHITRIAVDADLLQPLLRTLVDLDADVIAVTPYPALTSGHFPD